MAQKDTLQELISLQFESLSGGASHISEPPSDHNRQLDLPTSSHNPDAHNLFSEWQRNGFDFSQTDSQFGPMECVHTSIFLHTGNLA